MELQLSEVDTAAFTSLFLRPVCQEKDPKVLMVVREHQVEARK